MKKDKYKLIHGNRSEVEDLINSLADAWSVKILRAVSTTIRMEFYAMLERIKDNDGNEIDDDKQTIIEDDESDG